MRNSLHVRLGVSCVAACFVLALIPFAQAEEAVDYVRQIKPLLHERCFACHGVLKAESNLRLDTVAFAKKGGESGAAIVPGNVEESVLVQRISSHVEGEKMPPEGEPLTAAQVELIKNWIAAGALAPVDEKPEKDPRDHWAFQTPVRPAVPVTTREAWNKNPIDAFLAAEQEKHGLTAQPAADKRVWLRRIYLDLVGFPPSKQEQDAFLADASATAYESVVNRLLDRPEYGQRWGRHWMDIWRYSDAWGLGADIRNSQKNIWHWRDWIIESVNSDKGYDQIVREMLAADELYPSDLDRLRGSGFLARQYFKFNRTSWLDETVEHTGKAMLGLTFNCAKCHDHKYDPIAQTDYYALRAIFEPYQVRMHMVPGETDYEKDGIPAGYDCYLDAETFLHIRGDDRNPDKSRVIAAGAPSFLSQAKLQIDPVKLPVDAYQPGLRAHVLTTHLKAANEKIAAAKGNVEAAQKKLADAEAKAKEPATEKPYAPVREEFVFENAELWEKKSGRWNYAEGKLKQSEDGPVRAALQFKGELPANFEARLKYVTTGGQMWKSVGIAFDVVDTFETLAYASAYAGGPKAQVAYKNGGDYAYPADGAMARSIELNQPQELTLRVRGSLVNFLINGELAVAYVLPERRLQGVLQLITYDAQADLTLFELKQLPADMPLEPAKNIANSAAVATSVEQAKQLLAIAEKGLAIAELVPASLQARALADQARFQMPAAENAVALSQAAGKHERMIAVAKAEETLLQGELELATATGDKKVEAEKKVVNLKTAVATAITAVETPSETYTPLSGALKTLESNLETEESRLKPFPQTSSGRRTALANWLTDRKNPLTARVAVNHIWMRHFGKPLVPTVFDFGRKGTPPTHPELLDWLAVELIESGWSMKHLHRLITTSQAYRLSSSSAGASEETLKHDPENQYYWRGNPVRMQSQIVRDSLLQLAGELDLTAGGPPIPVTQENSRRRSMYFVHSHNEHQKFLSIFDDASVLDCYRRAESILPQQALALENSELATEMAGKIAVRISKESPNATNQEFLREAFITVLAFEPNAAELKLAEEGLVRLTDAAQQKNRPDPVAYARTGLIHALLNHNDFVTIR